MTSGIIVLVVGLTITALIAVIDGQRSRIRSLRRAIEFRDEKIRDLNDQLNLGSVSKSPTCGGFGSAWMTGWDGRRFLRPCHGCGDHHGEDWDAEAERILQAVDTPDKIEKFLRSTD